MRFRFSAASRERCCACGIDIHQLSKDDLASEVLPRAAFAKIRNA
jgi:hypothetical protein